ELLPNDEKKKHYLLDHVLKDIRNDYDYILIDVPPTISEFTNNALVASDYTLIIMQTEPDSLSGAISFKDYAEGMQTFNPLIRSELLTNDEKKKHYLLDHVLKDIRNDYDYILIDVPPTISEFTNNALVASDYTLIIMQTEPDSLSGAISFKDYAEGMQTFNPLI